MSSHKISIARVLLPLALLGLLSLSAVTHGQESRAQQKAPAQADDEVIRINTELVQTDVAVLDKQGRFVEGLTPEQFELTLDGKPRPISFFERITAGSTSEASQLSAARGLPPAKAGAQDAAMTDKGRVIFFFLDDMHLGEASLTRARKALLEFVENRMGANDQVAIVSASGQIGFLQQLTDYKPTLRTAIARLSYKKNPETYTGKVPISEYQAIQVTDHNDRDLFVYLLEATINEYQAKGPLIRVMANNVRNRVRQIASQSKAVTTNVLSVLEGLMESSAQLPGRKLVFFISDGFMADPRGSSGMTLLKRVTEMAARSGVVVYTMDARGTFHDSTVDASRNDFPDGMSTGTQAVHPTLENSATQEPLHILAEDTGGRAIIDSNSFADAFRQAIDETSHYYLLAWRPDAGEQQGGGKARIKVTIKGRPELRVRLRRNYYTPPPPAKEATRKNEDEKSESRPETAAQTETPEAGLLTTLGSLYPNKTIPTALSVGYVNTADQGLALKASMQIERSSLSISADEAQKAEIDVLGAAIDDRGVIVTFKQVVTVVRDSSAQNQAVIWNQQLKLPPGLYQVRVAVRERGTGRTGSARQWIEVPDLSAGRFQLSSLFLGERKLTPGDEKFATSSPRPVTVDVDRRFKRSSVLRFQTYVYNASRAGGAQPNVEIQARVIRDNRTFINVAPAMLPTDTTKDLARLPYWAELALDQLPAGRYTLQVTAIDRATKNSTSQQTSFVIE